MEPPEPFVKAMAILGALSQGGYLHFLHSHLPVMLFPELESLGMTEETLEDNSGLTHVFVWRQNDKIARQAVLLEIATLSDESKHR